MNYPNYDRPESQIISGCLASIVTVINARAEETHRSSEQVAWGHLAKVGKELGKAVSAQVVLTMSEPSQDASQILLDVALTALVAYEHATGSGQAISALHDRVLAVQRDVFQGTDAS